ncbi:hypothetical protein [Streptomyces kanasensis]|uniref:hypothetical protein n=1 Tax=Streptomyces kanasensis TaxID=936756 RepID=UPI00381D4668
MASGMDEDRLLAEIERLLAREDPELDATMSALGRQLTGDPFAHGGFPADRPRDRPADGPDGRDPRDWRKVTFLVAVVVAVVGLVLTAVLTQPADPATDPSPPPAPPPAGAPLHP